MQPKWYCFGWAFVCALFAIGVVIGDKGHDMSEGILVLVGVIAGFGFTQGLYLAMSAMAEEARSQSLASQTTCCDNQYSESLTFEEAKKARLEWLEQRGMSDGD